MAQRVRIIVRASCRVGRVKRRRVGGDKRLCSPGPARYSGGSLSDRREVFCHRVSTRPPRLGARVDPGAAAASRRHHRRHGHVATLCISGYRLRDDRLSGRGREPLPRLWPAAGRAARRSLSRPPHASGVIALRLTHPLAAGVVPSRCGPRAASRLDKPRHDRRPGDRAPWDLYGSRRSGYCRRPGAWLR